MLTYEAVDDLLSYNPDNGEFRWKVARHNGIYPGDLAGSVFVNRHNGKPYRKIHVCRKIVLAHRLAFLLMRMELPSGEVDHEDGNGLNNAWSNLRVVTRQLNAQNYRKRRDNTSGCPGVKRSLTAGKWCAGLKVNSRYIHLGTFSLIEDAIAARKAAEAIYGFHPNHGQDRPL
jgi:hypothetical protein